MIWSKLDFEREVRRQLIELESIRKRVPADSEVRQRIDRLEASHMNLLRKLEELFPAPKATHPNEGVERASFERQLRTLVKTSEMQAIAEAIRQRIAISAACASKAMPGEALLPSLDSTCATCGRLLISSLLAGDRVLLAGGAWHHGDCHGEGEPHEKPGMLN